MRLRLSWERWSRTRQLRKLVRAKRRELALSLMLEQQHHRVVQMEQMLLPPSPPPMVEPPPPTPDPTPDPTPEPTMQTLTEEERASLPEMPDPAEEIEHRLGLSTTPPSRQSSAG